MTNKWHKIKKIFSQEQDLATIGLSSIVSNAIGGIFWIYIASLIGVEHYGEVSYYISISIIASIISFIGAGNTIIVYTAKKIAIQPVIYFLSSISAFIASIILFVIFHDIGVSIYIIGFVVFSLVTSELLGLKAYGHYSRYIVIQKILMVALAIGLYFVIGYKGIILGIGLSFIPFSFRIYKGFQGSKIDFSILRSHIGFVLNSYLLDIARAFSSSFGKIIIAPLFGFVLLGNYNLGIQIFTVLGIIPGIVYQYILPHDASGNPNRAIKKWIIIFSVILAIVTISLSPFVLPILFPKFMDVVTVVQIISLAIIPYTINLTYISKFLGSEQSKVVLSSSVIYLGIQIVALIILGNLYGVNGLATAFVLAVSSETAFLIAIDKRGKTTA